MKKLKKIIVLLLALSMVLAMVSCAKKQEEEEKRSGIRGEVKEIGWGNQIRSYVMQPYTSRYRHSGSIWRAISGKISQMWISCTLQK